MRVPVSVTELRGATVMRGELPMAHPRVAVERPVARPAARPGFQRFGAAPEARPAEHPAERQSTGPAARGGAPAAHGNDPSWHKFQPQGRGKPAKPEKKDNHHPGGNYR